MLLVMNSTEASTGAARELRAFPSLSAVWSQLVQQQPDRIAVSDEGGEVSFQELDVHATQVAKDLAAAGLSGRRVAILCARDRRFAAALLGVWKAGGVAVPLTELHPPKVHRDHVKWSRAEAVVASRDSEHAAVALSGRVVVVDREAPAKNDGTPGADEGSRRPNDTALLLFTSGTTGRPKVACISDANVTALSALLAEAWGITPRDRLLHTLPLHHMHGLGIAFCTCLLAGAATHFLPRFEATRVWELMGDCTVFMGVPTIHKKLFDAFDQASSEAQRRFSAGAGKLRLVTSGSAKLPETLSRRWSDLVGRVPLERFGMTEVGVTLSNPLEDERRPGSCGKPLPGMEVRLVDEMGGDIGVPAAGASASGELWFRGPTVFLGYDGDEQATRTAMPDGWFRSGDTAAWLPGGYVKILGRTSVDIIKSGGYKLSALEIEEALREHPTVGDAAVVGIPDETWGERVVAAVVGSGALAHPVETELRAFLKQRLAPYQVPKSIVTLDDLPRNALGKVTKRALIERLQAAEGSKNGDPDAVS